MAKMKYPGGTNKIKLSAEENDHLKSLQPGSAAHRAAIWEMMGYTPKKYPAGSEGAKQQESKFNTAVSNINSGYHPNREISTPNADAQVSSKAVSDTLSNNVPANKKLQNYSDKGDKTEKALQDATLKTVSGEDYKQDLINKQLTKFAGGTSGIHIKPENRGKFTAYKERTGETTEEALHSPNAHVRQMANFARNAAKWHHEDGVQEAGIPNQDLEAIANRNKTMKKSRPTYGMGTEELGGGKPKSAKQQSADSKTNRMKRFKNTDANLDEKINQGAIDAPKNDHGAPTGDQQYKDVPKAKKIALPKYRSGDEYATGVTSIKAKTAAPSGGLDISKAEIGNKEPKDPMINKSKELAKTSKPAPAPEEKKEMVAPKVNVSAKPSYDHLSFGQAFNASRGKGEKEFEYKGKKYHTKTKEEVATAAKPAVKSATVVKSPAATSAKIEAEAPKIKTLAEAHKEANPNSKGETKIVAKKSAPAKKSSKSVGGPMVDAINDSPSILKHATKQILTAGGRTNDNDEDDNEEGLLSKTLKSTLTGGARYKDGTKKMKKGGKDMGC